MAKTLWRRKDAEDVVDAFVSKDFRPVMKEYGVFNAEVDLYNSDPHSFRTVVRSGPDGVLKFIVSNTYDDNGNLLRSGINSYIDTKGSIEYILQGSR